MSQFLKSETQYFLLKKMCCIEVYELKVDFQDLA